MVNAPGSPSLALTHPRCSRPQNRCCLSPILLVIHLDRGCGASLHPHSLPYHVAFTPAVLVEPKFWHGKMNFHSPVRASRAVRGKAAAWCMCCEAANPPRGRSLWAGAESLPLHAWVVPGLLSERLCNRSRVLCRLATTEAEMNSYFGADQTL